MTFKTKICIAVTSIMLISGCCAKFNDVADGTRYNVGQTFTSSNIDVKVEQFQWGNGNWTSQGYVEGDATNYAMGTGNAIRCNNANLNFQFSYPVNKIHLKFADLGGNSNISVNGDFRNIARIQLLNGQVIGSATVSVSAVQQGNNWIGSMDVVGNITSFSIGGQELWLDDVCAKK